MFRPLPALPLPALARRVLRLVLATALIATTAAVLPAAQASAYTGADFADDLLAACPQSGRTPSAVTGPAESCTFVPLDASGRPIDTANGNADGTPDPANVTSYWTASEPFGNHTPNCSTQYETGLIQQEASSSFTTSLQWTYSHTASFLDLIQEQWSVSLGFSFASGHSELVNTSVPIPPYYGLDWYISKHMQHIRGAMKVVLKKWVADPSNPAGGMHKYWYPGLEVDAPAEDPTDHRFFSVTNHLQPMNPYDIKACAGSAANSQPLVSKYGTEHGTNAGGFCLTVTPEVLSTPCAAGPGAQQDQQQFIFLPVATTTGSTRYMIVNVASASCLAASPAGAESPVVSVACDSASLPQLWLSVPVTVSFGIVYTFQWLNASSNMCMNAWASQPAPLYGVNQQRCIASPDPGSATQIWAYSSQPFAGGAG